MSDGFSLIRIDGKITEPATVLINKISAAIGGGFKPRQIRRVAEAEADAEVIKAKAQIEITALQQRALTRFVMEESKKQDNIESITEKAIGQLNASSTPQYIEDDWITNFFDKCRIISDEDMQILWAKVLAGEANSPGTYSKRTVNALGSLDKTDAELFIELCSFTCLVNGRLVPFIYHEDLYLPQSLYEKYGLNFDALHHLASIGLITFESVGYVQTDLPQQIEMSYHKTNIRLEFEKPQGNKVSTGNVLLTTIGKQMAKVCSSKEIDGFIDYVISKLSEDKSIVISSPYPKQDT
ncbi:DUF2806 domain-containing protein [Chloroflexota bacterium]